MLERIAGIIREQLNLDNVEITEETSYNVEIPSKDLEKLEPVGDVMDYIRDKEIDA